MVDAVVNAPSRAVRTDRVAARRRELAAAALETIADRGFVNTGLRDIAAHTGLSLGILHYYFDDKDDLIGQAVWQSKVECAHRYDAVVATSLTSAELAEGFGAELAATLVADCAEHRLWYDLRNQALFQNGFRDTIIAIDGLLTDMVWSVVARYAELSGSTPQVRPAEAYAMFDGFFRNSLIAHLRDVPDAPENLRIGAVRMLHSTL
ncbi:TetR/AcrR family transcriptional regulator [Microbacterium sp. GXF6406]